MGYIADLRRLVGTRPIIMTGVTVIVRNEDNDILLQKRSDTRDWGVTGGALELAETFEAAAHRELYEEAGLRAESMTLVALLSGEDMYYRYPHGDEVYNAIAVYEAEGVTGTPQINDDEGLDLQYFALDKPIPELNAMTEKILRKTGYLS